ncbi:MAG: type II toxin-antitoxin system RelE/ParE family toxin [Actinobacteria bacterium]|nr:type II toxin-antitoxin system RelE/ParE family toxin [Actinomycetota bacterium]MCG2817388.1 type II toxin-antitoxin system RelE/ParE family toxin [Actinomycetes bacterium]MBU4179236.1 type II toxin-antitoxin system RelE/ParE family toxin [Actinomycetota bacterium]MBU4217661.1 type II toxin-antitoxin system RelE/ParE family toxin [Actinomycetota bacterium]MBU4358738.1 type II toxin-antitoxin system RelE/ParE family toxin [Actinomycetota bacterium]
MAFSVHYKKSVTRDLKNLDKSEAKRVIDKLEGELKKDPDGGEKLKGKFAGLSKLRVGDYRVIYTRTKDGVIVLLIAHRKDVYRKLERGG